MKVARSSWPKNHCQCTTEMDCVMVRSASGSNDIGTRTSCEKRDLSPARSGEQRARERVNPARDHQTPIGNPRR